MTLLWNFKVPILQRTSPAQLVASTICRVLGNDTSAYTYVDFCSGAGGPTPFIEHHVNNELLGPDGKQAKATPVKFLLTDLHPHIDAWKAAVKKSDNLDFIKEPVDATNAPKDLLKNVNVGTEHKRLFRMFNLAFHHFDDELAIKILENTLETADGFG